MYLKGVKVPYIVEFSEGGGISGHIPINVITHIDALKLYENDGKKIILSVLLVDGNGSHFEVFTIHM